MKNENPNARVTLSDLDGVSIRQRADGKVESVGSTFTFDKLTGLAEVVKPDGTVISSWQCNLLTSTTSKVLGWALPTVLQADLPAPDVEVKDNAGNIVGRAYSVVIPKFWDVPVADSSGNVSHYTASVLLPDASYVNVSNLTDTSKYYILTP